MNDALARPGRCVVMGVLNVTPDSFSDGGCYADRDAAVAHGLEMAAAGADYVDVGGETTKPGADRVDPDEECRRVLPVIAELSAAGVRVSVDTTGPRSPRPPSTPVRSWSTTSAAGWPTPGWPS